MKLFALTLTAIILTASAASAMDADIAGNLIGKTIKDAGAISNVNNALRVDLVKGKSTIEELDAKSEGKLEVTKIDFDTKSGTFSAYISANGNLPFEVNGKFAEVTKVPVLNRRLEKDQVISKSDIAYLEIEPAKLRGNFVTSEEQLIGRSPIRAIYKARPIAENQVAAPKAIEKNKQVTIVYNDHALSISTAGIALENGRVGDVIKFKNASSNRIVTAKVMNEGTAEVIINDNQVASN